VALAGCGSSSPVATSANLDTDYTNSDYAVEQGDQIAQIGGAFHIALDIEKGTAEVTPIARQGNAIGDLFYLNVDNFGVVVAPAATDTFTNLDLLANTIDFNYTVSHSFPAPSDPTGTASGGNRADLGVSGRAVFLVDAPATVDDPSMGNHVDDYTFDFGTATATVNPKAILNADGYYDPAGMIDGFHTATNGTTHWPFKAVVDEGLDSRTHTSDGAALSNGGDSTGNYASTTNWSSSSAFSAGKIGLTGYGVLHQGQTAANSITLNIAPGNTISLDAVVICTYTDPRGGANSAEKRANRLPKNDPALYAYAMPHGAVDMENVALGNLSGTLGAAASSTATGDATIVDQDATTTVGAGLGEIPEASGVASIELAAGEIGAQTPAFAASTGTGSVEDPLVYTGFTITNTDGADGGVDAGAYYAVRVVDEQTVGFTLNNDPVPVPVASGSEQTSEVIQVGFIDIA
jgi:hypothetical protein